jgi:glycosyltransferase involved in cell wall biosynthesis
MRIGMLLMDNFPPDIRVEKEVHSLSKRYDLHILCTALKGEPIQDNFKGMKITRFPAGIGKSLSQLEIIIRQTSSTWLKVVSEFVENNRIQVLHVHDLPLVGIAQKVAEKFGIRLVADLHENYPAMLIESKRIPFHRIRSLGSLALRIFFSEKKWRSFEENILPKCDAVISVVEEAKMRLAQHEIDASKIYVVSNYNLIPAYVSPTKRAKRKKDGRFTMIYAGGVDETRDLATLIKSLSHLEMPKQDFKVVIVGANANSKAELERLALSLGVQDYLEIFTWVSREKVEDIMDNATVGLVPHRKSEHTDTTIPHKIFQYMYRGLPVIVSNCAPLERVVNESSCGLVYNSEDSVSLARCIERLYEKPDEISEMGACGKQSCIEKYNWKESEKALFALYENLKPKCVE